MAHNYFLANNRQTRITVEAVLPPDVLVRLTMDTQVTIGQKFAGKIIDYSITETSGGCLCRMVLCEASIVSEMPVPHFPASSASQSFVYDIDLQNLFDAQNACALAHTTGILKLPVTTVYLQLRDLTSQPIEPKVYRI